MRRVPFASRCESGIVALRGLSPVHLQGRVASVLGLSVEVAGLSQLSVGDRIALQARGGVEVPAEIVGFRGRTVQAMPFGSVDGLGQGSVARASARSAPASLPVGDGWIGRVIDPLGRPLDGRGALTGGATRRPVRASPPDATRRARLGPRLDLGVRVLNTFAAVRGSASACSPGRAWGSPPCWQCWRAIRPATWPFSLSSGSGGGR
jgi:flagellum-specific ATP synthase